MIIKQSTFNQLGIALSTLYLSMKILFSDGQVRIIQGDQEIAIKCYVESLKVKRVRTLGIKARKVGSGIKPPGGTYKGVEAPPTTNEDIKDRRP